MTQDNCDTRPSVADILIEALPYIQRFHRKTIVIKYGVRPEKAEALRRRFEALGISEADLEERFVRGGGPGGQKVNKTSSCVYLHHIPSGIEIKCQRERSQALNRFLARRALCDQLEERILGEKSRRQQEIEKIRHHKRHRSRRARHNVLEASAVGLPVLFGP